MINLDERYLSYLDGSKKMRIDGIEEKVESYGWHCDGNDIKGHYVTTENYLSLIHISEPTRPY